MQTVKSERPRTCSGRIWHELSTGPDGVDMTEHHGVWGRDIVTEAGECRGPPRNVLWGRSVVCCFSTPEQLMRGAMQPVVMAEELTLAGPSSSRTGVVGAATGALPPPGR